MRVLGIDPGSLRTGWGIVDLDGSTLRHVRSGVIRARQPSLVAKLAHIHGPISEIIAECAPDSAALEAVFSHRNPRSAILLGHARGAALAACGGAGLHATEYAPTSVKLAVSGYGRAGKAQVQQMVQRLLHLDALPVPDEADALAVSICHSLSGRLESRVTAASAREQQEPRA